MAKLILPPSVKAQVKKRVTSTSKMLRTGLNAPLSAMKKITIPESQREKYTDLSEDSKWYTKHMIGFIYIISDLDYSKLQRKRSKKRLYENGYQQFASNINEDM